MARKPCCRQVDALPAVEAFKPQGVPRGKLETVALGVEEMEAIRLADLEGLYHEAAAERMGVSRATFGRIVTEARRKVAEALVRGKALEIKGGHYAMDKLRTFICNDCAHTWQEPCGTGHPAGCPSCQSQSFQRSPEERKDCDGHGHGHGHGQQGGCCGQGRGQHRQGCKTTAE